MTLTCIDDAIKVWRKVLMKITNIPSNMILNGESIRGAELATIKNGQKVPIGYDETCIVLYYTPLSDNSIVDTNFDDINTTLQSYELHLIVYGNQCKKVAQAIKSNLYSAKVLDILTDNGIGLLSIPYIQNNSTFINSNTYVLRNDISINFDCVFEDEKVLKQNNIDDIKIDTKEY